MIAPLATRERFELAARVVGLGGGIVSVDQAARIAGMERRAFIDAMLSEGPDAAEAIEDALDNDACREALEEMKRPGGEPLSFDETCANLGIDPDTL